jgi:hypothetical protein
MCGQGSAPYRQTMSPATIFAHRYIQAEIYCRGNSHKQTSPNYKVRAAHSRKVLFLYKMWKKKTRDILWYSNFNYKYINIFL